MWKGVVSGASLPGLDPVYSVMNLVWGEGPQSSKFCLFARSHFDWPMTTKILKHYTLPQKIEVKEVLGSPFSSSPTFMGYASSSGEHVGNLGNITGRLSEHVGKCIMGNMVPTSKSKKI
jgi:hypothetical protein